MDDEVAAVLHGLDEGKARRLLEGLGQRAALREFERQCARAFAIELRRRRVERRHIVERLIARYGFSERKAYMVDDEAIAEFCKSRVGFARARARSRPRRRQRTNNNERQRICSSPAERAPGPRAARRGPWPSRRARGEATSERGVSRAARIEAREWRPVCGSHATRK